MARRMIPAAFWRGGTSKGLFFRAEDLPPLGSARDAALLAAMGSPDSLGRQLNGMGGGTSSVSKAMIVAPSTEPGVDLDYTFAQVAVDRPLVDWSGNCGNLTSAVAPFALEAGLLPAARLNADGTADIRLRNMNSGERVVAAFALRDGALVEDAGGIDPGVSGPGGLIRLNFLGGGGSAPLPTGHRMEEIEPGVRVSLGHVTNPVVFVAAEDLGVDIAATPEVLEGDRPLLDRLERLRRIAGVRMGLADDPARVALGNPKIACVGPAALMRDLSGQSVPAEAMDVAIRAVSMGGVHRAVPVTMALCAAALATMPGTLLATLAVGRADATRLRLGTPSGVVTAEADVVWEGVVPAVRRVSILRTARLLMSGLVNSANINDYPESHSFAAR